MPSSYDAVQAAAGPSRPPVEWVTWQPHRRTIELARALEVPVHLMRRGRVPGLGRWVTWLRSVRHLFATRSRVVIVQNPSLVLTVTTSLLKPLKGYKVVQDLHSYFYQTLEKPRG